MSKVPNLTDIPDCTPVAWITAYSMSCLKRDECAVLFTPSKIGKAGFTVPLYSLAAVSNISRAARALALEYAELRHEAMRALVAWDGTVLPKAHDGLMQERMECLREALARRKDKPWMIPTLPPVLAAHFGRARFWAMTNTLCQR